MLDADAYRQSRVNTAERVTNRFDDAELDYWLGEGAVTYLTRADWQGALPVDCGKLELSATGDMINELIGIYDGDDSYAVGDFM